MTPDAAGVPISQPCRRCKQRIADDGWCPCDDPRDDDYDD